MTAKIAEIFYSIQGEGIYQGVPQVFVRFWGCDMGCDFCDTRPAGYRDMDSGEAVREVLSQGGFWDSVSFTGGEPLLQAEALKEIALALKKRRKRAYLETSGMLTGRLSEVIEAIDVIAMDFKLPSSTKRKAFWDEHRDFLRKARERDVFVKAVVTPSTLKEDIVRSSQIISGIDPAVAFVLQPAFGYETMLWERLEGFKAEAEKLLSSVRIIPQIHKHIGVR